MKSVGLESRRPSRLDRRCRRWTATAELVAALALSGGLLFPNAACGQENGKTDSAVPEVLGKPRSASVVPSFGSAFDQIPIFVSPGRRNVEPHLFLAYSSLGGQGDFGLGWDVELGHVERWRGDGTPTVGDPDSFLFTVSSSAGELHHAGGGLYRARIENLYREFRKLPDADHDGQPDGWTMLNGEGVLHRFGGTPESRIDGQLWMIDLVQDPHGNTITYSYERVDGALYPTSIRYTGYAPSLDPGANRVTFEYEERPDVRITYRYGVREERHRRLKRISSLAGASLTRRYELEYQQSPVNGQSLLSGVILVGDDDVSRIRLRACSYSTRALDALEDSGAALPLDLADADGRDTGARVVDVNGDGFADITGNGQDVYLGDGRGGFTLDAGWSAALSAAGITFVIPSGDFQGADAGVRLLDLNGDGLADLFIAPSSRQEVWLNTGTGWAQDAELTESLRGLGAKAEAWVDSFFTVSHDGECLPPHCGGALGDFPGCTPPHCQGTDDDPPDCIPPHCEGTEDDPPDCVLPHCTHELEFTTPFDQETLALVDSQGDSKGVQLTDVNGDGRVDIVWSLRRTDLLYWNNLVNRIPVDVRGVFLHTGHGWRKDDGLTEALWEIPPFTIDSQLQGYDALDVNGDGLADITRTLEGNPREVLINTTAGWQSDDLFSASLAVNGIASLTSDRKGKGLLPLDFNDDGLLDYLRSDGVTFEAWRNTGQGWEPAAEVAALLADHGLAFTTSDGKGTGVTLGDLDGNGLADFISAQDGSRRALLTPGIRSGLPLAIDTALGETTTFEWTASTRFDNRRPDGVQGLPAAMAVAVRMTRSDGRGHSFATQFDYGGGLFEDRRLRSFGSSGQLLPSGLLLKTNYHQSEALAGQLKDEDGFDAGGQLRTRRSATYSTVAVLPTVTQVQLIQTDQQVLDPGGGSRHTRVTNAYDDRLLAVSVIRDPEISIAGDETVTQFVWARNDPSGMWALPSRIQISGPEGVVRESVTLYDGLPEGQIERGLPTESRDLVAPGDYVSKRFLYDRYGNVVTTINRNGDAAHFEYGDPTATFRTRAVDPEGRVLKSEYDPRFGALTRDEGADGNATTKSYDAFGRLARVTMPGDEASPSGTRSYTWSPLGDPQNQFLAVASTETAGTTETLNGKTFFDGMGLIYRVEKEGPDGSTTVNSTEYDDAGNIVSISRPYFAGEPALQSRIERDELHRPVRIVEPDGLALTVQYFGIRADVVDRRGFKTSYFRDADGRITGVKQWVSGQEQSTSYRYDVLGQLTGTTDGLGEVTRIAYDALGRRSRLEDPNAGTYTYRYDPEGNLIQQTAPGGGVTDFSYNRAGELIRKSFPDGTAQVFTYGGPGQGNSTGRVTGVQDAAGLVVYGYDRRGNVIERRRTVLGRTYLTGYAYDSLDRLRSIVYPDGLRVLYTYDAGGNLARVTDGQGSILAENSDFNAAGQIGGTAFGNGVVSGFGYDQLLRMASINTATPGGDPLQNLDYSYDGCGNILALTDHAFGASQIFQYDEVGRLTRAVGAYGEEKYEYDAAGNLLRKGNLAFAVDPQRLQRVVGAVQIEPPTGSPKLASSLLISYDERGNVVQKGSTTFAYDSENHLVRMTDRLGKLIAENVYDFGGQRVIQRTPQGSTVFIDGIYEEGVTHVSRHVRAGPLLVATLMVPRATVTLITQVADAAAVGARGGQPGKTLWAALGCLAALAVAFTSFPRRAARGGLDCCAAFSQGFRLRPWTASVLLALAVSMLNLAMPEKPALAWAQEIQQQKQVQPPAEKRYFYHSNHLGSVHVVTDEHGKLVERRDYRPYGEPSGWTGPQSGPRDFVLTFDGQRYDNASGLYYFGARHYDADLGRFLSADTTVSDPMNPKTLHRYAFAGGNPVRYADPTGHGFWDIVVGVLVIAALIVITAVTFGTATPVLIGVLAGAILGGAYAWAKEGNSPLTMEFWEGVFAGAVLGAIVGAGIQAAVFLAASGTLGTLTSVTANALMGAMTGAIENTIAHLFSGGGIETLLGGSFYEAVAVGFAVGAVTGYAGTKLAAYPKLLAVLKYAGLGLTGAKFFAAGYLSYQYGKETTLNDYLFERMGLTDSQDDGSGAARSTGVPAAAFLDVWPGYLGSPGRTAAAEALQTLPLTP